MALSLSNSTNSNQSLHSKDPNFFTPKNSTHPSSEFRDWLQQFDQLKLDVLSEERTFVCNFAPVGRACFNVDLLQDLRQMQRDIADGSTSYKAPRAGVDFDFMVVASATPEVYNLGGDLSLFRDLVKDGDREGLRSYAQLCVDVVCDNEHNYRAPIVTIAAVEGSCLGGGFEAALSCDVIIAEEHVKFGFPEILFGLFPGMGAINFLTRRLARKDVVDLILGGKTFSANSLHQLGLIDEVVPEGEARAAVQRYVKRKQKNFRAHASVHGSIRKCQNYSKAEFDHIIDEWVSVAMQLSERDLNKMLRLAQAQERKRTQQQEPKVVKKTTDSARIEEATLV